MNCWEHKKCGREAGGINADELGVCPAYTMDKYDGVHGGKSSGRTCWVVAGTYCGATVTGTFASKLLSCFDCDFYKRVRQEERAKGTFRLSPVLALMKLS